VTTGFHTREGKNKEKETADRVKTDYERSVDKPYQKKRQRGSLNSYIKQIPVSMSGTSTNKNKEKQIDASTTDPTNLFVGLNAEAQKAIDNISAEELAHVINFYEQTKMRIGGILSLEDLLVDKNFEPRWCFELGQPLVKPELVNKLPTKMRRFHD
jgi:hypothetical protein